ncbi:MAG: hypothetical protein H6Q84_1106, partial [Deltaproteobacteria bacterium]|nr:hypothetical protein [Deltaproteobacteria bacterium]
RLRRIWERDFQRFLSMPHLLPTRMANVFFGVLTFYLLFFLLYSSTGSFAAGLSGPLLYFTFPEVFVRSSYGGYNSIENFCLLLVAYLYAFADRIDAEEKAKNGAFFVAGLYCAFASQKTAIIILAMAVLDFARRDRTLPQRAAACLENRITRGFAAGMALFCVYGMSIDTALFVDYYLKGHILERFHLIAAHHEYTGPVQFHSIPGLWKEFGRHLGFPFLLIALPFPLYALFRPRSREGLFGLWFLAGAVLFSVTDWRMTKNLALVILPLLVAPILLVSRSSPWVKAAFLAAAVYVAGNNLAALFRLARDFSTISPYPFW